MPHRKMHFAIDICIYKQKQVVLLSIFASLWSEYCLCTQLGAHCTKRVFSLMTCIFCFYTPLKINYIYVGSAADS